MKDFISEQLGDVIDFVSIKDDSGCEVLSSVQATLGVIVGLILVANAIDNLADKIVDAINETGEE